MIKPREKLISEGSSSLSEDELLAIILGSGSKSEDVFSLSKRIIDSFLNLSDLLDVTYEELILIKGIKKAKATKIIASLELAKRIFKYKPKTFKFTSPLNAYDFLRLDFFNKKQEYCIVLFLDKNDSLIKKQVISLGDDSMLLVDIKFILKTALKISASNLIMAHNHPSDTLYPSEEDVRLTQEIDNKLTMMDLHLIDHLIIGNSGFYSFALGKSINTTIKKS